MNELSHNELALAAVGISYITIVGLFAWRMSKRGDRLLRDIREQDPAGLWEELGSPTTLKEAFESGNLSLRNFIRSGETEHGAIQYWHQASMITADLRISGCLAWRPWESGFLSCFGRYFVICFPDRDSKIS